MLLVEVLNPKPQILEPAKRVMASSEIATIKQTSLPKAGDIFDLTQYPDGGSAFMDKLNESNLHEARALALKDLK